MKLSKEAIESRQNHILSILREQDLAYVDELSQALHISEITIRRDLKEFERLNLIERFHGGARLLCRTNAPAPEYLLRQQTRALEKSAIAQAAAQRIVDGDTVFLSSSTTALAVLDFLGEKKVRIITNNTMVTCLHHGPNLEIILTGGEHSFQRQSLFGEFASSVIGKTRASKCLLGANGVCPIHGITTTVYAESPINQQMLSQCGGESIILADGEKIGYSDGFVYGHMGDIDTLVTDSSADPAILEQIRASGVRVIVVAVK